MDDTFDTRAGTEEAYSDTETVRNSGPEAAAKKRQFVEPKIEEFGMSKRAMCFASLT
jgi:hypothetical protein